MYMHVITQSWNQLCTIFIEACYLNWTQSVPIITSLASQLTLGILCAEITHTLNGPFVCAGYPKSSSHACMANTLSTKPPPKTNIINV